MAQGIRTGMKRPRIAASTYLNSLPLCWSFLSGSHRRRCEFIGDLAPARCAEMLHRGDVDIALIPSIEYQRLEDVLLVPDVAVAVRGAVRSVILLSKKPLEEVRSVALDLSSRTAAALTRIYFRHFLKRDVGYRTCPPDLPHMLEEADAALLIGDPALKANYHNTALQVTDWGVLWKQLTGLPFVFALWAIRREALPALANVDFDLVKREATSNLPRIIDEAVNRLKLPPSYLEEYLTTCIHYELDEACLEGLRRFYQLGLKVGVIDSLKPMQFCPAPKR